ncbi:DALR anticodon-binding domain-containing protein 3 [Platysternon megacephalum]|uniref:DALR anticodon-binding domain-containing protein 3 n=1 Tax=Platysternon megacephalum TaxID=55544 RepID=A0A4D9EPH0_9SAUR|nr:DALR anticodon-binding domain-containing protein 3 [Platysternon megacephalum]
MLLASQPARKRQRQTHTGYGLSDRVSLSNSETDTHTGYALSHSKTQPLRVRERQTHRVYALRRQPERDRDTFTEATLLAAASQKERETHTTHLASQKESLSETDTQSLCS